MSVVACIIKHMGPKSPIRAYKSDMSGDVDELVAGGMDKDAAWLQVIDEKLTNLRGEKARIEQVVADAYANTAAGKRAPKPAPAQAPAAAPAGEVAAVEPVAESAPTAPINTEDAGAELTYNRRNRIKSGIKWDDIASKNDALKVKEAVKQSVYPRPDYQALVDGGMQPLVAHLVKQAYDAIAAKPNTRGAPTDADLQAYIAGVNRVMAGVLAWANDPVSLSKWATREARSAGAMLGKSVNLSELAPGGGGKSMMETVYPEGWKGNQAEVIVLGGNKLLGALQPSYDEAKRAGKAVDAGWPASQEAWEKRGIKIIHAEKIDVSYYEGKRSRTEQPYVSISYKVGQTRLMDQLIDGAESQNDPKVQAAVAAELEANQGMFIVMDKARRIVGKQETEEAAKDVARELTKREGKDGGPDDSGIDVAMARREGPPRRLDGENVSSDQLKDAFGFKGVNFGNWMKGDTPALRAERQAHLNHAYDSFADLADLFGVPAKAMSLNGMLGLAIGAQGNGKYAAHFVPGVNEINLTRASGAGSLAHEWGHALDHYFAEQAGFAKRDEPFLTEHTTSVVRKVVVENGRERMVVDTDAQRIRPEIVERFKAIVQAMNRKPETVEQFNARQERSKEIAKSNVSSWLKSIRRDYVAKGVDEAAIDAIAARILALDVGDGKIMVSPTLAVHPVVDELRSLYRKKAGRVPPIDQIKGLQSNLDYYAYAMSEKPGAVDHVPQQVGTDYAAAAAGLDNEKGGKRYWSTNLEKFARAFDAFVSDELEAKAAKNTYLSHAGRTGETVPMGDERKTINAAIKALVGEIQTRTDDAGNVALFSRAPGIAKDVANAWRILSENDEVFTYAKSDSTGFAEIANGTDAIFAEPEPGRVGADVERAWRIYPAPGGQPDKSKRGHVIHYKDGKVELNVENFTEGSAGSAAYAAVGNYAFNNGLQFAPDRFGMTQAAIERRLESLISLALKFGSTDFIRLSPAQLKAFKMKWRDGDTAFNTEQMLMASYNALAATFPEIKGYTYDLETGARKSDVGAVGRDEPGTEGIVARARAAGARAGKRTVARAIFTNTFASEPAGKARRELLGRLSDGNASLLGDNALAKSLYSRRSEANAEELRAYAGAESGVAGDVPLAAGGQATPQSQIRRAGATDGLAASRPGQAGVQRAGVPIADAEAVADAIRSAYPTGPQIVVLDDVRKAPEQLLDQIRAVQAANTVEGAYYKGKIYLFPQNVSDIARLMFVGAHHEIRHAGLDALFGKRKGALLLSIAMSNPKVAEAARAKMAEGVADSMIAGTEEALADMPLEDMAKLNGWNKIVAAVRQWLRDMAARLKRNHPKLAAMIEPDQWTDNDVAALIRRAEDISRGGTVPARPGGAVFSREPGVRAALDKAIAAKEAFDAYDRKAVQVENADEFFALSEKATEARDALAAKLLAQPDDAFALQGRTSRGRMVIVNGSAQNPGQWQLTRFDGNDEPWGDSQYRTKESALTDFLREIDLTTLQDMDGMFSRADQTQTPASGAVFSRAGTAKTTAQRQVTQAVRNTVADMLGNAGAKVSWWDKTLGTQYAKAQKFPAYKRVFDAVQQYLEDTSALANEAADQAKGILPKLETWKDLKNFGLKPADAKAIAAPIFEGTLTDQKVYDDAELAGRFKLTPAQIAQYKEFRAAVNTSLDQAMAAEALRMLGDKNAALRELALTDRGALRAGVLQYLYQQAVRAGEDLDAQGDERGEFTKLRDDIAEKYDRIDSLKAQGYAPLMRFGQYKLNITDRATGQTLFFGLYESKAAANAALRDMQGDPTFEGADFEQGVLSQEQYKLFSSMPLDSLEMFAEAIGADQSDVYQDFIRLAKSNRSAMKRLLKRKGTAGFSEDVPRVLAAFVTSNARMAAGALNMPTAKEAAQDIRDGDVQDEAIKLLDVVQNPTDTAGAVRSIMFVNFIGGSIASAVVNLTQPLTMTLPYLSQFGGGVKAAKRLMAAGKMAASGRVDDLALRVALKRAETDGIVSPQEIHHLTAQAMGTFGTHPYLQRAAFIWAAPFSLAEQFNRRVSFIAAFETAREQGIEDPFSFAEKAVTETQGLYNKGNAPNLARGTIGAAALTFKQFSIHYLEWMGRMWKSGPQGKKAVGLALALLILAAGTDGLPFADDLDDLIDTLGQALGYDMNVKRARREFVAEQLGMGDTAADVMARGFSAVPGIPLDVSIRMSMGNLLPGTGMFLRSNTDKSRDLLEIAGPAGGLAKQYIESGTKALKGDFGGAVQSALPVAFQNAFKGVDMWTTGEARDTLGRKVMDADEVDGLMKFIGFQPQAIARESEKIQMIRDSEQLAKNVEGEIASAWARAIVDKDPDGVADARAKLAQWNEDNPDSPIRIKMQQIITRAKKLREDRASRFITSVSPERRRAVAEALE